MFSFSTDTSEQQSSGSQSQGETRPCGLLLFLAQKSLMPSCFVSWKMLVAYLLGGNVKAIFYHWKLVFYSIGEFFGVDFS